MEESSSAIAPLLLRNLLTSTFIHADQFLVYFLQKCRFLQLLRRFLVTTFLFFLRLLPSLFPSLLPSSTTLQTHPSIPTNDGTSPCASASSGAGGDSSIARALTQLLLIMNDLPVSSRKYEVVRSLADKLIDGNLLLESNQKAFRDVNAAVLSVALSRTLMQLEEALLEQGIGGGGGEMGNGYVYSKGSQLVRGFRYYGGVLWRYAKPVDVEVNRSKNSAEKLAAEVLWLAQKMVACGCAGEAVSKWASASKLAWQSLTAEPRLQGSLVKVSAFLIKQAKEMDEEGEECGNPNTSSTICYNKVHEIRQTKMKMLLSWMPLLCRANNGTDAPILSMSERAELERVLEAIIWTLDEEEEQERVLAVWLHHFTYCSASDWPNLRSCYTSWFDDSRTRFLRTPLGSIG